ncbi:MAG: hypothetical protein ACJA1P_002244, partial [Maribacter sp.]
KQLGRFYISLIYTFSPFTYSCFWLHRIQSYSLVLRCYFWGIIKTNVMIKELKKTKKYLGYLQMNSSKKEYQICDVSITANEIVLSTLTPIAP